MKWAVILLLVCLAFVGGTLVNASSDFVKTDEVNALPYSDPGFQCLDFAFLLAKNAAAAGFPVDIVLMEFDEGPSHAVVMFYTKDGFMYVEPQTDEIIHPKVGCYYLGEEIVQLRVLRYRWVNWDEEEVSLGGLNE